MDAPIKSVSGVPFNWIVMSPFLKSREVLDRLPCAAQSNALGQSEAGHAACALTVVVVVVVVGAATTAIVVVVVVVGTTTAACMQSEDNRQLCSPLLM